MADFETQPGLCCALLEISGISGRKPKTIINEIIEQSDADLAFLQENGDSDVELLKALQTEVAPIILFTGAAKGNTGCGPKYSGTFRDYIEENGLGEVDEPPAVKNFNSGNYVTLYVWNVDYDALLEWWQKDNPRVE